MPIFRLVGTIIRWNSSTFQDAKDWLYRAITETSHTKEPYIELVRLVYNEQDWPTIYLMVEEALKRKIKPLFNEIILF
ncbi:hypothetical protein CN602_28860 [Bacillus cereus]|uniref:hypothetical protein n=1 Tax=Bacillus cereus TaxID=1396 RepID=UPI000BEF7B07|nr:hypothetical protein [Bacillus cereus]PEL95304.1 hypothetical protein CN602_28860 [Bacillus cereus]